MIFKKENIIETFDAKSRDDVLLKISDLALKLGIANNSKKLLKAFITREEEGTTGFEDGISIPHARIKAIKRPAIIVVKYSPITWPSMDGKQTHTSIALLVPKDKSGEVHMDVLSTVAKALAKDTFKNKLKLAKTKEQIFKVVNEIL